MAKDTVRGPGDHHDRGATPLTHGRRHRLQPRFPVGSGGFVDDRRGGLGDHRR